MKVTPREAPEGSVFTFRGRGWRPGKRVEAAYGMYCRPYQACPAIGYIASLRADAEGRFTLRLRAGEERPDDADRGVHSGAHPRFEQGRVARWPRYRVIVPPE